MWQDVVTEAREEQALCKEKFVSVVLSKNEGRIIYVCRFLGQSKSRPFPKHNASHSVSADWAYCGNQ